MKTNKLFALVEKNTVRVTAIVEEGMADWFRKNFTLVDVVEVSSTSAGTLRDTNIHINYIGVYPTGSITKRYYMVTDYFGDFDNVNQVYDYILGIVSK